VDKLRAAYRTTVIIGLAMMASLLVFAAVVGILEQGSVQLRSVPQLSGSQLEIMKYALLGVTAIAFFVIRFVTGQVLNAKGEQAKKLDQQPPLAKGIAPEFGRLATAAIITYVLCETPAIFGLVLYLMGRNSTDFYLFLIISLLFYSIHFPKLSQWEEWYRERDRGRDGARSR